MQVTDRAAPKLRVEPQILSLFPLGASRDTRSRLHIDVRGYGLENAYAVWTDCQSISAEVKTVEEIEPEGHETSAKDAVVYRVALELSVAPDVGIGAHFIRIITPSGVSNASAFVIHEGPQ